MTKQNLDSMLGTTPQPVDEPAEPVVDIAAPQSAFSTKTFDPSEVMTPRLAIAQGLSPEVRAGQASPGDFLLMGHDAEKAVTLVIAGHADQRRFVEQGQQKARCWSPDGIQGYGDPGIACAECPFAKWTDTGQKDAAGKTINKRPPCDEIDAFAGFSVTHGMPVVWPLKGTAAKTARFIKTLCNGLGMGSFAIDISTVSKEAPGRAWHEPVVKINPDITKDEAEAYAMIARGAVVMTEPAITAQAS